MSQSTMRPQISVMTSPVPIGRYVIKEPLRRWARLVRDSLYKRPAHLKSKYGGHPAVTRSVVEGLQKIGVRVTYNPRKLSALGEVVFVPSGFDALGQAIHMKRSGYLKKLLAGPNLVEFPSDRRDLITAPEIDVYLTTDDSTRDLYVEDCPELSGRCQPWPAGVDTGYWQPAVTRADRHTVLLFIKPDNGPVDPQIIATRLEQLGYQVEIIRYGSYTHGQYLQALRQAQIMVGFSRSESQGIAWAEAWSADVPTLIVRNEVTTRRHKTYKSSTAPYLSSQTGRFFNDLSDFETVFDYWKKNRDKFNPRQWVVDNLSDERCAQELCKLAGIEC
jgi:hypothetical protein